ncbi:MAG: Hint domain-containing protein [Pseudomonadota bacterium]
MPDFLDGLFIGEMLVDNPSGGGSGTDTDGDGGNTKADEYVEIQNASGAPVSLDGYEIWSEDRGLLYSFDAGDTIGTDKTATVVGEYTGTPPDGFYDAGHSNTHNFLEDGEGTKNDSIFLVNTDTGEYVVFSYGDPPQAPSLPTGFPGTTQIGIGETLNSAGPNNVAFVRDADGNMVEGAPNPGIAGPVCYCPGTLILTDRGEIPVEELRVGDRLVTADNGLQPVLWIGVSHHTFEQGPHMHKPIEIKAGSLGDGRPHSTLMVSPQHHFLLEGPIVDEPCETCEVLALAKALVGLDRIRAMNGKRQISYYSLLCARHEVIMAAGVWSETLYPGPTALRMVDPSLREEIEVRFPAVKANPENGYGPKARRTLTKRETEKLVGYLRERGFGTREDELDRRRREIEARRWDEDLADETRKTSPKTLQLVN